MNPTRFLQIHTLTSYPGTLLNRDDAGFAKRLPFGGSVRTRVSSQCLKYHWRNFEGRHALSEIDVPRSYRSRETFRRRIVQPLVEEGYPVSLTAALAHYLQSQVLADNKLKPAEFAKFLQAPEEALGGLKSNQVTILGRPEVDYLKSVIRDALDELRPDLDSLWQGAPAGKADADRAFKTAEAFNKADLKKNLRGLQQASGLDAALFGRMVTSDMLARGDAAIHVAHAITTHAEESESDYFSAVDELVAREGEGELGSGHINTQELTSGLFYGYVVVDVPLLIRNLGDDPELAAEVVRHLVHLVATVSPGAKLGSTAPYAYARLVLLEAGDAQPRTLANAFHEAVPLNGGVAANSYDALASYVRETDAMYGPLTERRLAAIAAPDGFAEALGAGGLSSVPDLADWAAAQTRGGA